MLVTLRALHTRHSQSCPGHAPCSARRMVCGQGRVGEGEASGGGQDRRTGVRGRMARYQVYVHFGVAQGPPRAVTRYHSTPNFTHRLLCYQVDGKVLIHLEKDRQEKLVQTSTNTGCSHGI